MKRLTLFWFVLIPGGLALAVSLFWGCQRSSWTTDSPDARNAYQRCIEADMKLYSVEAREACEEALELDPEFVAAKLRVALLNREKDPERAKELFAELRDTDLGQVTSRERFLVRFHLARFQDQGEEAEAILEAYLQEHPDDPFAMHHRCMGPWMRQEWDEAAACYQRVLEADPNWVVAQNHLGYIAMAQGRFADAEELFETYRFIAPDQANPHDSLGELLTLIGRYDEAEHELEQALAVRADFCASYDHLITLFLLNRAFDRAEETFARRQEVEACRGLDAGETRCRIAIWPKLASGAWEEAWQIAEEGCLGKVDDVRVISHSAAVHTGRMEQAAMLEEKYEQALSGGKEYGMVMREALEAMVAHMRATRLEEQGDLQAALEQYRFADERLPYWTADGLSIFKLFNKLSLAAALRTAGDAAGEDEVLRQVRSVNPRIEEDYYRP